MEKKIIIELTPFQSVHLISVLEQFVNGNLLTHPNAHALRELKKNIDYQIFNNMTDEQIDDANLESLIKEALGEIPPLNIKRK